MQELYDAIKEHCDIEDDSMVDAANYGASAGFCGFTYYHDTCKFYDDNERIIMPYLDELAENMGYDNALKWVSTLPAIDIVGDIDQLKNLYSWIILEEVGRWVEEGHAVTSE